MIYNCVRVTWKAMKVIPSWSSSFRKGLPSLLLHKNAADIWITLFMWYNPAYLFTEASEFSYSVVVLYRFTSDVKLKSISIVGGTDGTSPAKMRAWDPKTNILISLLVLFYECFKFITLAIIVLNLVYYFVWLYIFFKTQIHQSGWYWLFRCSKHATRSGLLASRLPKTFFFCISCIVWLTYLVVLGVGLGWKLARSFGIPNKVILTRFCN